MKTFNLSQSYPTQDIRKHTSFLTISLSACLLAAGLILLFLPEINSQSNIDILRMVAGSLMVCIAVYLLVFALATRLMQKQAAGYARKA